MLDPLEEQIGGMAANIETLFDDVLELQQEVNGLVTDIGTLEDNLAILNTDILALGLTVTGLENTVNNMPKSNIVRFGPTLAGNPADSTLYYLVPGVAFDALTVVTVAGRITMVANGSITKVYGSFGVAGTLSSNQPSGILQIRKNNATNFNIDTAVNLNTNVYDVAVTGLSILYAPGDYFHFSFQGPAWTTNPTTVSCCFFALLY